MEIKHITNREFFGNIHKNKEMKLLKDLMGSREFSIGNHHRKIEHWTSRNRFFTRKADGCMGFYLIFKPETYCDSNDDFKIKNKEMPAEVWDKIEPMAEALRKVYANNKIPVEVIVVNGNENHPERKGLPCALKITCERFINKEWRPENA